jgi:hypothetical protein
MTNTPETGVANTAMAASFARARALTSLQIALERLVRSFSSVRATVARFHIEHVDVDTLADYQQLKIGFLSSFVAIDVSIAALAADTAAVLENVRHVVPELPSEPKI